MILNLIITIITIILLVIVNNYKFSQKLRAVFNSLIFIESLILTFYFAKFPGLLALPIVFLALYYLFFYSLTYIFKKEEGEESNSIFPSKLISVFRYVSIFLIFISFVYEYFADMSFSSNFLLVSFVATLLFVYEKQKDKYYKELDFLIIFFSIQLILFITLPILYKISTNQIGQTITGEGWIDDIQLVYFFLALPLSNLLQLLGIEAYAIGQDLYYPDLDSGIYQKVGIAESCSGINSIILFIFIRRSSD